MEKIVLDTNFLLAIPQLRLDIFAAIRDACDFPYELYVLQGTVDELENLINTSLLSRRRAAQFAMKVVKQKQLKVLEPESLGSVDDQLVALDGCIVATVDKDLKQRLKAKGTRILTIRQKKYVLLE